MCPFAIVPLLTVFASGLVAQPSQTVDLVVTPAWLAERLTDAESNVVVLHVEHDDYRDGHIPGARELDYGDIVTQRGGLRAELPRADEVRAVFERLGVSDSSYVIVYAHEAPMATRVLFSLAAIGHERFALLDGGLQRWRSEGHAVSRERPVITTGRLSSHARASEPVVVDAAWISERIGDPALALLDTRTDGEYNGTGNRSGMPSTGHLAGARQLEWQAMFTDGTTRLKPRAELEAMFAARAERGDTVVTYCWVGYRASATWFIARYLGYDARMYDGSYQDWRERELPTTSGTRP